VKNRKPHETVPKKKRVIARKDAKEQRRTDAMSLFINPEGA